MAEEKKFPKWAKDLLVRLEDHTQQAFRLLQLSITGISGLAGLPEFLEALTDAAPPSDAVLPQEAQEGTDWLQNKAQLARSELHSGFPLLSAQATISLWADLENGLRTFLAAWLRHEDTAKTIDPIQKLKVSLGEYEAMDPDERCLYTIDRLELEMAPHNRPGIDRFEALFKAFGFETTLDERLKRDLRELYSVRNLLVHRRGIADRRFIQSCPWLGLSVGKQITMTPDAYFKYHHAVTVYLHEIIVRVSARFGFSRSDLFTRPLGYKPREASLTSSNQLKAVAKNRSGP